MKRIGNLIFVFASLLVTGCSNPVDKSNEIFEEQVDTALSRDLYFLNSTMEFLYYANASNYWYPEEYTSKDIVNDGYKQGYRGLTKLNERVNSINIDEPEVIEGINGLKNQIQIAQKEIKKMLSGLETTNFLFGSIGG